MSTQGSEVGKSAKVKNAISKAEAIQQREQLRQMVLNKFINDLAKNNKKKQDLIQAEVDAFFKIEKITEKSLKDLKNRVQAAVTGKVPHSRPPLSRALSLRAPTPAAPGQASHTPPLTAPPTA